MFDNSDKIKKCPFCNKNKLIIFHNYTANNTDCTLLFKCDSCNQILDTKQLFRVIDASYIYSNTINNYLNLYCKNYGNALIEKKIFDELKSTEAIGFLGCQWRRKTMEGILWKTSIKTPNVKKDIIWKICTI